MEYRVWKDIYGLMKRSIAEVRAEGNAVATEQGVEPGPLPFLWFDAIANSLYDNLAAKG
jgi:hypothetical protein